MTLRNRNGHRIGIGIGGFGYNDNATTTATERGEAFALLPIGLRPAYFADEFQRMEATSGKTDVFDINMRPSPQRPGRRNPFGLRSPVISGEPGVRTATNSIALIVAGALVGLALVVLMINSIVLGTGLRRLHADNLNYQQTLQELEVRIQILNTSLPDGNGTVFFDDNWWMLNGNDPSRQFMLNASLVVSSGSTPRNYAGPDADGVLLLDTTLNPVFAEDQFAIVGSNPDSPTTRIEFDLSLIPAATLRLFSWPNKDGTVALYSDVLEAVNSTSVVFLDNEFTIVNYLQTSKRVQFYSGQIDLYTNRTFSFPDLNGTLGLTDGAQTISHKSLDNTTSSISVVDSNFVLKASLGGYAAHFSVDALSSDQTVIFPDLSGTLVLTTGTQTLQNKFLDDSNSITVLDTNLRIRQAPGVGVNISVEFDTSTLTADRSFTFQDRDGCFVGCLDQIIHVRNNNVNSSIFSDAEFMLESADNPAVFATFDTSDLSQPRNFTFPDQSGGALALASAVSLSGDSWTPILVSKSGFTGTPTFKSSFYSRTVTAVLAVTRISGLFVQATGGFASTLVFAGLPFKSSVAWPTVNVGGLAVATHDSSSPVGYDMGTIQTVHFTNQMETLVYFNSISAGETVTLSLIFGYPADQATP